MNGVRTAIRDEQQEAAASPVIRVDGLRKTYNVPERESGLRASVGSLFRRQTKEVVAVAGISFDVAPGEVVGFLGPNGAGKTTTLKMLSGLLYPSEGEATVLSHVPWQRERAYLRQMTLVMGQRNQLVWDIPVADSFELNRAIYRIPEAEFRQTRDELSELLDLAPLLTKPVRNLSLGERMKCGLAVTAQRRIRVFITEYAARYDATVLLTSHYMADVEALAERVIVIHHGALLFDGALGALVERFSPHKTVIVDLEHAGDGFERYGEVVAVDGLRATLRVPKGEAAAVTARLLAELPVVDLSVSDPPIDEVIDSVFTSGEDPVVGACPDLEPELSPEAELVPV